MFPEIYGNISVIVNVSHQVRVLSITTNQGNVS